MSQIYVGANLGLKIQVPMEEDVSSQANGTATVFTVSKTPISDRDQDGVANEPAHVTVYVNGSEVTVNAVNDSTGQVTLASAPSQGSRVIIEYRYDVDPEIADEIAVVPRQTVRAVYGLGSNKPKAWAPLLRESSGSLKETFSKTDQFTRLGKKKLESKYSQQFWSSSALDDFQGDTGNFSVDNQELLTSAEASSLIGVKNSVLPIFRDGIARCKMKYVKGDGGFILRWDGTVYYMYQIFLDYLKRLTIKRKTYGAEETLLQSGELSLPADFFPFEAKIVRDKIDVDVNGQLFSVVDPDPLLIKGMPGFYSLNGAGNRYDDFQVWNENSPDEYGLILAYTRGGSAVKVGIDGVVFPEGSIPSPKSDVVYITSSFRARKIKVIP